MTVREYAEKILLSTRLEDKLAAPPVDLKLDPPSRGSYQAPSLPGRPESLLPRRPSETRTKLPSAELLSSEEHRSVLLHFFCNHELIAVELMALALLKFPDAPDAFRRGLLHTLQEEQEHTRLYMNRMAETGTTFGDHSLSRMIWDHISTMDSPLEYVSRLSLTFEQSNLDFAHHYSKAFHKVGDEKSSQLLAKIYHDEIAHVGYGLKWLRRFKEEKQSDWDAWHNALARPLTPIRAKAPEGNIPFNEEARRKAGLDDDFIKNLLLYNRSRGRTPHVHYFNPNCEAHILAELNGKNFQPNKNDRHLEEDLEVLIIANAHHDDMVLLRNTISSEHLASLKGAGLPLPEIITDTTPLATRKLGGFRPWAWSPDSSKLFQPFADNPTPNSLHPWEQSYPALFYSKELTSQLSQSLELSNNSSKIGRTLPETLALITEVSEEEGSPQVLLKSPHTCAGRSQLSVNETTSEELLTKWISNTLQSHHAVIIEPHLPRILDLSALYEISRNGEARFQAFTRLQTDAHGRYLGTTVAPKIGNLLPKELAILFHKNGIEAGGKNITAPHFYKKLLPAALPQLLSGYHGPIAVDALFYQHPGEEPQIRPIVEVNARCSMGRIAHNLRKKISPNRAGTLTIHRLKQLNGKVPPGLPLNDPSTAQSFLATWEEIGEQL